MEDTEFEEGESVEAPKLTKKKTKSTKKKQSTFLATKRPPRLISFDVWAKSNNVPAHHMRGMRAHVKNSHIPKSKDVWDKLFADY